MARLEEKIALVTGAGRGIGRAMAVRLAQEGAYVVVADIDRLLADETAAQVMGLGRKGLALQADVSRQADIEQMVEVFESKQRDPLDVINKKYVEFRRACP